MNNIKSYEAIAREAGYVVTTSMFDENKWWWYDDATISGICQEGYCDSEAEAWKAACIENGLVEE